MKTSGEPTSGAAPGKPKLPPKAALREKAMSELKHFAVLSAYLFVTFAAIAFFKFSILKAQGVDWAPLSFALIKALLAAKFILIGNELHIGERHQTKPLIWVTLHKSVAFLVLVAILTVVEEAIVGLLHGRGLSQSMAELGGGTSLQLLATLFIVFLVFLPLFAFSALARVTGEQALVRTFFVERLEFEVVGGKMKA